MKNFDVQSVALNVSRSRALAFLADPEQLPRWTSAFASVRPGRAVMRTAVGEVEIGLRVEASPEQGTVDWQMTFPDGSVAAAFSRVVALGSDRCVYTFVLLPPPLALEELEGALEAQSLTLAQELRKLREILQ